MERIPAATKLSDWEHYGLAEGSVFVALRDLPYEVRQRVEEDSRDALYRWVGVLPWRFIKKYRARIEYESAVYGSLRAQGF